MSHTGPVCRAVSALLAPPLRLLGAAAIAAMAGVTLADILLRATIRLPIPGVVEVVEVSLALATFAGIALAFLRGEHVAVDLLGRLPRRLLLLLDSAVAAAVIALLLLLVWLLREDVADAAEFGDATAVLGIPVAIPLAAVVGGFAASAVALAARALDALLALARG
ncbi:MAG: TRAP transporter small permease [Acetobacteraceae bacterium]|nr:TRAP transporter small permease [Rhodovarius sp.]MCX7685121.1 TRAP transporter small permease [Acetobacteraceae bacterium]MDW8397834.1 TRAP transporter small permease subunit [Acetobacteraceae bacterium]